MREIEIKLKVADAAEGRRRLERAGATPVHPRSFEDNRLYDDATGSLARRGQILRLRSAAGQHKLAFKKPPDATPGEERYKVRIEIQTTVGDPSICHQMLTELGFRPIWRYQKHREVRRLGDADIMLDETPIGVFFEIEGPPEAIDRVAAALGYGPDDYMTKTYRQLHEEQAGSRTPGDLVFEDAPR